MSDHAAAQDCGLPPPHTARHERTTAASLSSVSSVYIAHSSNISNTPTLTVRYTVVPIKHVCIVAQPSEQRVAKETHWIREVNEWELDSTNSFGLLRPRHWRDNGKKYKPLKVDQILIEAWIPIIHLPQGYSPSTVLLVLLLPGRLQNTFPVPDMSPSALPQHKLPSCT